MIFLIKFGDRTCLLVVAVMVLTAALFGQAFYCKKGVFAAMRPVPKLIYACSKDIPEYDERLLKARERTAAIGRYARTLETFTDGRWWTASVDDLTSCDINKKPGALTTAERKSLKNGDYSYRYFGDCEIRVIPVADPCYQTGYGGSDIFLLYRKGGRTYASENVDGFSSRADNPISVNFASLRGEQIIEIATSTGGLNPMVTNYYFAINKRTNGAVPKNLFKGVKGLTNEVNSMMLLDEPEEYGLRPKSEPLVIVKNHRLEPKFSMFEVSFDETAGNGHEKFVEKVMRWNGKYYQ